MHRNQKNRQVVAITFGVVFCMVALAYASVPLYRLFCQVTGYGGTTQVADQLPQKVLERTVTVTFNADTGKGLGWAFRPDQKSMTLQVGAAGLAYYTAVNTSDQPIVGTATFNVTPLKAGRYFTKIECFCFEEQTLNPGETANYPVLFYVEPAMDDDPNMRGVTDITLSYTFFKAESDALANALKKDTGTVELTN